jgi:uncharacterized Zn finger protein
MRITHSGGRAMNPLLIASEVQSYLDGFSSKTRRRGKHYYEDGSVVETECIQAGTVWTALVQGSDDYKVTVIYRADQRKWSVECTCPVGVYCKHGYATMLALQKNPPIPASSKTPSKRGKQKKAVPKESLAQVPQVRQPPESPVVRALSDALGRKFNKPEAQYIFEIQTLFQSVRQDDDSVGFAELRAGSAR